MTEIIYIGGPMTGYEGYNKKAFFEAAEFLKQKYPDCIILNPAILPDGLGHEQYMRICLPMVEVCTMLYMLKKWEHSDGANDEHTHGQKHNKKFLYQEKGE